MRRFAELYEALDATTSINAKVEAMVAYFKSAPPEDAAWAVFFLTGARLKRLLPSAVLHAAVVEMTRLPDWLLTESYAATGDFAEAIALLADGAGGRGDAPDIPLHAWIDRVRELPDLPEAQLVHTLVEIFRQLPRGQRFLFIKLLTGEMRVGVSATLVVRALAETTGLPTATIAHRLMGGWEPSAAAFRALISSEPSSEDLSRPYPYFLASPLDRPVEELGPLSDWLVEWKWDGIRGQLLKRQGRVFLWSRGEELITDRFPEIRDAMAALPDGTVLDGEVLAFEGDRPMRFSVLQRRIGRQKLTPKILAEAPAVFMVYDLLEHGGQDLRERPLQDRRELLRALLAHASPVFRISEPVQGESWAGLASVRAEARARNVEGFMLKRLDSPYRVGRKRGDWWKWKIDPYSVDAVLIYAQPGNGRRATLLTDYTFGLWSEGELVTVAKAYSGLSDEELLEMDRWIRQHTLERFGPVRAVEPTQVFELHFEAIAPSTRHKSGIAVRFPRIARRRTDKLAKDADTLEMLKGMLTPDAVPAGDEDAQS